MNWILLLLFVVSQVDALASNHSQVQADYLNSQVRFMQEINALSKSNYSHQEINERTNKIYQDFLLSPLTQEYITNVIVAQRDIEQGKPEPPINLIANTPQGTFSIQSSPSNQQYPLNYQQYPINYQQQPFNYQQQQSNYQQQPSNYQQQPSNYQTNPIAPSVFRPAINYPDIKNSLNKPDSSLKDIGRPVGGGLNSLG
ncbi:uncharacterized protein [Chironomus tepperi]|uniref:uncharacterized protein n=1 Tax=Chironomus tepperi TaxID=113505 RepID=UPI00391F2C2A